VERFHDQVSLSQKLAISLSDNDIQATTIMDKNNNNEDPPKRRRHQIKMKIDHTVRPSLLVC
jgi:hypothetical protein